MFRRDKAAAEVDTLLAHRTRILGDLHFDGGLHLDGSVAGNVRAPDDGTAVLSVSEQACIDGSVRVPTVILSGTVRGDIHALTRVVLGATSKVEGNVVYGVIEMALGAEIRGKLIPWSTLAPRTEALPEHFDRSGHGA